MKSIMSNGEKKEDKGFFSGKFLGNIKSGFRRRKFARLKNDILWNAYSIPKMDRTINRLVNMGEEAIPIFAEALESDDFVVRKGGAKGLGKLCCPSTIPILCNALKDEDNFVAKNAAEALGNIGKALLEEAKDGKMLEPKDYANLNKMAIPALVDCLKDRSNYLMASARAEAAKSLGKIGNALLQIERGPERSMGYLNFCKIAIPALENASKRRLVGETSRNANEALVAIRRGPNCSSNSEIGGA